MRWFEEGLAWVSRAPEGKERELRIIRDAITLRLGDGGRRDPYEEARDFAVRLGLRGYLLDRRLPRRRRWFGKGGEQMTFEELGQELGVTRQRVQQLWDDVCGDVDEAMDIPAAG